MSKRKHGVGPNPKKKNQHKKTHKREWIREFKGGEE